MSAQTKLKSSGGRPESELTKLKGIWRGLSDDARSFWRDLFVSDSSQAAIRGQLLAKLKVNLRFDKDLNRFRKWVDDQLARDEEAERMIEDESRLREEFGESWTLDQIREEVLKRSYARALATGDFAAGRKTIVQDLNVKKINLDREKFLEGLKSKIQAGLDAILAEAGNNPKIKAAVEQINAATAGGPASIGGKQ